jgi:perosamine synthetase
MKIKLKMIPFAKPIITNKTLIDVKRVLKSGQLVHGPLIKNFEKKFSEFTGAKYSISVSSCTAGMHLIYYYLGLKKGDEVIIPAQTHAATAMAVEAVGAKPIFVDSDTSGNIDINKIEKSITKRTKVITVVHYLGLPVNLFKLNKIVKKYKLFVLEDCALSLGSRLNDKHTGLLGDAGVFSFYPVKHMTTSEGGMIITKNKELFEKLTLMRAFGVNKDYNLRKIPGDYDVIYKGINCRMSEIEAAIGLNQISNIKRFIQIRRNNYSYLKKLIKNIKLIEFHEHNLDTSFFWSYYCFPIILSKKIYKYRTEIIKKINSFKIGTSIYYPKPVPRMSFFKKKYKYLVKKNFLNAEKFSSRTIMLPIGQHLSIKQIEQIAKVLKKIFKFYNQ